LSSYVNDLLSQLVNDVSNRTGSASLPAHRRIARERVPTSATASPSQIVNPGLRRRSAVYTTAYRAAIRDYSVQLTFANLKLPWYESGMREANPLSRLRKSGAVSPTRTDRRPIRSRNAPWAQATASYLARLGVSPNQISLASVMVAGVGAFGLGFFPQPWNAISCVCGAQLRLLGNLLDGMVAVEHGKQSQLGVLYNELPDRVSDSVLFVALGYASGIPWLGWLGALLAALTAYIRVFGGALGFAQNFDGPMAKQHRMAVLTAGCLISIVEHFAVRTNHSLPITCGLIAAGSLLTCGMRTRDLARSLRERG
jgi:phosphatidylglycerophosphate synthase